MPNVMPLTVPEAQAVMYLEQGYAVWRAMCGLIKDFPNLGHDELYDIKRTLIKGTPLGTTTPGYEGTTNRLAQNCALCHCIEDCAVCPLADGTCGEYECGDDKSVYRAAMYKSKSTAERCRACEAVMAAHKEAIARVQAGAARYAPYCADTEQDE